jgi:hypothetical protein
VNEGVDGGAEFDETPQPAIRRTPAKSAANGIDRFTANFETVRGTHPPKLPGKLISDSFLILIAVGCGLS